MRLMVTRRLEILARLALEIVADAAGDVRRVAGDAEKTVAAAVGLGPDGAARALAMDDAMRHAAQQNHAAMGEGRRLRETSETRADPGGVLVGEGLGFLEAAARRQSEHDFARGRVDAQRIAPRLTMTADTNQINRPFTGHLDRLRLGRPTIKHRTQRHGMTSTHTLDQRPARFCHNRSPV
jgi:hypothetical protein